MKRFLILLLLTCIVTLVHSQGKFEEIRIGGPPYHISSREIIETYDGGYMVVSSFAEDSPTIPNTTIFKVLKKYNVNGELLWQKEFEKGMHIGALTELQDGSIICTGGIFKEGGFLPWVWAVFKIDACGDFVWGKKIDLSHQISPDYVTDNALDVGDGIIITAFKSYDYHPDIWDWVKTEYIKLDYDGNLLWRRDINFTIKRHQMVYGSCLDREGNIILTGQITVSTPWVSTTSTIGTFITKTDPEGNVLFDKYSGHGFDVYNLAWNAPVVDNENIVYSNTEMGWRPNEKFKETYSFSPLYVSDTKADTTYTYEIKCEDAIAAEKMYMRMIFPLTMVSNYEHIITGIFFTNKDYEPEGNKDLEIGKGRYFRGFSKAEPTGESNFKNERYNSGEGYTFRLLKLDKKANELKRLDILPEKGIMEAVITTRDNQVVMLTNNPDANDRFADSYIMKYTDSLTASEINTETIVYDTYCSHKIESGYVEVKLEDLIPDGVADVEKESLIRLSPNPAKDRLTIYFSDVIGEKHIGIYNLSGQKVKSILIGEGLVQHSLDISELKSGLYFVRLSINGEYMSAEKLIVE